MNGQRKTKKQLLEDLQREPEHSIALQEVSNKVADAHNTDEVLDLIVNEAVRLIGASAAFIRLLEGGTVLVESEFGKGSTSTMKLPAVVEESLGTQATQ